MIRKLYFLVLLLWLIGSCTHKNPQLKYPSKTCCVKYMNNGRLIKAFECTEQYYNQHLQGVGWYMDFYEFSCEELAKRGIIYK